MEVISEKPKEDKKHKLYTATFSFGEYTYQIFGGLITKLTEYRVEVRAENANIVLHYYGALEELFSKTKAIIPQENLEEYAKLFAKAEELRIKWKEITRTKGLTFPDTFAETIMQIHNMLNADLQKGNLGFDVRRVLSSGQNLRNMFAGIKK